MQILHALHQLLAPVNNVAQGANNLANDGIAVGKSLNRTTPWGQGNQRNYNQQHQAPVLPNTPHPGLQVMPTQSTAAQTFTDSTYMPDLEATAQNNLQNTGGGPLQFNSPQLQQPQYYNQQQPNQVGVTQHFLNPPQAPRYFNQVPQMQQPQAQQYKPLGYL